MGSTRIDESDGDYRMRQTLRSRLVKVLLHSDNAEHVRSIIVNMILNDIDGVLVEYWGHLGDMGWPKSEYMKVKRAVKKRL
jgi:hypothetical protein